MMKEPLVRHLIHLKMQLETKVFVEQSASQITLNLLDLALRDGDEHKQMQNQSMLRCFDLTWRIRVKDIVNLIFS